MQLLPIRTPLIKQGDDLASLLMKHADMQDGDIIAISSKVIATSEGAEIDLHSIVVGDEAKTWAEKTKRSPAFMQAVLSETKRMNGQIIGDCPGALLTNIRPDGLKIGMILAPNAGLDESNIEKGKAIGWPIDPLASAISLKKKLESALLQVSGFRLQDPANMQPANLQLGIMITDSCCVPRRLGVLAFALTVAGFEPLKSEIGSSDLFGRTMRVTVEATADQLATAANILMGNAAQSTPAVIIRDHGIVMTDYCGWVNGIEPEDDLFKSIFKT